MQTFSVANEDVTLFVDLVRVLRKLGKADEGNAVTSDESRGERARLIREILQHVLRHPDAKDTLDGIHKFWLSSRMAHQSRDRVREALDYLVEEKGWLIKKVSGASAALYGLNKSYLAEVQGYLCRSGTDYAKRRAPPRRR